MFQHHAFPSNCPPRGGGRSGHSREAAGQGPISRPHMAGPQATLQEKGQMGADPGRMAMQRDAGDGSFFLVLADWPAGGGPLVTCTDWRQATYRCSSLAEAQLGWCLVDDQVGLTSREVGVAVRAAHWLAWRRVVDTFCPPCATVQNRLPTS